MAQTPCIRKYFTNVNQITYSISKVLPSQNGHIGDGRWDMRPKRPHVPLWAIKTDANGNLVPVQIAIMQLPAIVNFSLYYALGTYSASVNATQGGGSDCTFIVPSERYEQYLYKKLWGSQDNNVLRFNNLYEQVTAFFSFLDPASTDENYLKSLDTLAERIKSLGSPELFVPPAEYRFDVGNAFTNIIDALIVAEPNFVGFVFLEINNDNG